jgi:hypothetical protein
MRVVLLCAIFAIYLQALFAFGMDPTRRQAIDAARLTLNQQFLHLRSSAVSDSRCEAIQSTDSYTREYLEQLQKSFDDGELRGEHALAFNAAILQPNWKAFMRSETDHLHDGHFDDTLRREIQQATESSARAKRPRRTGAPQLRGDASGVWFADAGETHLLMRSNRSTLTPASNMSATMRKQATQANVQQQRRPSSAKRPAEECHGADDDRDAQPSTGYRQSKKNVCYGHFAAAHAMSVQLHAIGRPV